jgi:hypothetical protein
MNQSLSDALEQIAVPFAVSELLNTIVHWGHPVMMGIVVLVMGSYTAYAGWQSRLSQDGDVVAKNRADHRKLAPWLFLLIVLGYTGGILSLVMQKHPILESSHFWTGSYRIGLLAFNGLLSITGFNGDKKELFRTIHAYIGSIALILLLVHGVFGLQLGLSL